MPTRVFRTTVIILVVCMSISPAFTADFFPAKRLGLSLATLQQSLEKVARPVTFTLRPGSPHGTQEARLPNQAGAVQASGDPENLAAVVLWLPVDQSQKRIDLGSRAYLDALVRNFIPDTTPVTLWIEQVLRRALSENAGVAHLESQLFEAYQFKAMYAPSMSPPMLSLTVTTSEE